MTQLAGAQIIPFGRSTDGRVVNEFADDIGGYCM
jgi:hypothetical protein